MNNFFVCILILPLKVDRQAISMASMMNQAIQPPKMESIIVYETLPAVAYI